MRSVGAGSLSIAQRTITRPLGAEEGHVPHRLRFPRHLDDALRGWDYKPIYDVHGDLLFRQAKERGDESYRGVAVRFGECIYRRLVGSLVHECLHAVFGDVTKANYGVLFGLPYGVPIAVPPMFTS